VVFLYNLLDLKTAWKGIRWPPASTPSFSTSSLSSGLGKGGMGVLSIDGKSSGQEFFGKRRRSPSEDETFDIGQDMHTGVAMRVSLWVPFKFTGRSSS
jgi:hypothetical protein